MMLMPKWIMKVGALCAVAVLVSVGSHPVQAETCKTEDPNIFCDKVESACPPSPGIADALCNGGLVTSFAGLYHNSHKFKDGVTKDFGFGPNVSMLPWIETSNGELILYSPDGSPTPFVKDGSTYKSKYVQGGDLRTIVEISQFIYEVREPAGSWTRFGHVAPRGEMLPTETQSTLGLKTTLEYSDDTTAIPSTITGPDKRQVTFKVSESEISITDADAQTTTLTRKNGRITKVTQPGELTTTLVWNEKYNLITAVIDPQQLPFSYTYDVQDEKYGVLRQSKDVVAAHKFTYSSEKTAVESVGKDNATVSEPKNGPVQIDDKVRSYDPMGYVEYIFAGEESKKYVTMVLEGLTPGQTFFAGSVKQDSAGRVTETTDSFGLTTTYEYKPEVPFVSKVVNHDKTYTEFTRAGKEMAYAVTNAVYASSDEKTLYSETIAWQGINRPGIIIAGPIGNSSATQVSFEYKGKLPSKVTTSTTTDLTFDEKGFLTTVSGGGGSSISEFNPKGGHLKKLTSDGDVLNFTRSVDRENGALTTTVANSWFSIEKTVSLSGTTSTTFTNRNSGGNQGSLARYDFSNIEEMITGRSQAAAGPKMNYAPISSITTGSSTDGNSCTCSCTITRSDGTKTTCDGKTICTPNADGTTSCDSTSDSDDSRTSDYACVPKNEPLTEKGQQCCDDGFKACPVKGDKCLDPKECCAGPGTTPPAGTGIKCCSGEPCPSANGQCMAVDKCVKPTPTPTPTPTATPIPKCASLGTTPPPGTGIQCCEGLTSCPLHKGMCVEPKNCCAEDGTAPRTTDERGKAISEKCCVGQPCPYSNPQNACMAVDKCVPPAKCKPDQQECPTGCEPKVDKKGKPISCPCAAVGVAPVSSITPNGKVTKQTCCNENPLCPSGMKGAGVCYDPTKSGQNQTLCCYGEYQKPQKENQCCKGTRYCSATKMCVPTKVACCASAGKPPYVTSDAGCCSDSKYCAAKGICIKKNDTCSICGDGTCHEFEKSGLGLCTKDCCVKNGPLPAGYAPGCCDNQAQCGSFCQDKNTPCCAGDGMTKAFVDQQCCTNGKPLETYTFTTNSVPICKSCAPLGQKPLGGHACCQKDANGKEATVQTVGSNGVCAKCVSDGGWATSDPCCLNLKIYSNYCQSCAKDGQSPKPGHGCCPDQNLLNEGGVCKKCAPDGEAPNPGQKCCVTSSGIKTDGTCGICAAEGSQGMRAGDFGLPRSPCCKGLTPDAATGICKPDPGSPGGGTNPTTCLLKGTCTSGQMCCGPNNTAIPCPTSGIGAYMCGGSSSIGPQR